MSEHKRYRYMGYLSKMAAAIVAGAIVATVAVAVASGSPEAAAGMAGLGTILVCLTLLIGDILIRMVTPDPFKQFCEEYEEVRQEYQKVIEYQRGEGR